MSIVSGALASGTTDTTAPIRRSPFLGALIRLDVGVATSSYKNEGWYAAGSAWETWVTTDAPATIPPSSHTLTYLQHMVLA